MFAPCEKVLIDQANNPSLIGVIQQLTSPPPPPDIQVPPDAMGLMRWDVFTLWQREDGDDEREFVQECQLIGPHNTTTIQASMPFKFVASTQRNIMSFFGFPLVSIGEHLLKLWLRTTDTNEFREVATFPVIVTPQEK
jgi:hypothetical protein